MNMESFFPTCGGTLIAPHRVFAGHCITFHTYRVVLAEHDANREEGPELSCQWYPGNHTAAPLPVVNHSVCNCKGRDGRRYVEGVTRLWMDEAVTLLRSPQTKLVKNLKCIFVVRQWPETLCYK